MARSGKRISDYTFGHAFLSPANCRAGSNIRALRETGVRLMMDAIRGKGWVESYSIVAVEDVPARDSPEFATYPVPLADIADMSDEEVC